MGVIDPTWSGPANNNVKSPENALCSAVYGRNAVKVSELLADGVSPDAMTDWGEPMLLPAARLDNADVLKALLNAGAQVDLRSVQKGETALMAAAEYGQEENIRILLASGANAALQNNTGETAAVISQHGFERVYFDMMSGALDGVLHPEERRLVDKWSRLAALMKVAEREATSTALKTSLTVKKPLTFKPS